MMKQRFLLFLLVLALAIVLPGNICKAAAYPQVLTLNQAVSSSVNTNYAIRKTKSEIKLKNIELKQAIQAIKDIRWKESTIQFSLLFDIKFPTEHALPKELELVMKVPKIQAELDALNRKLEYSRYNAVMSAKTAYFNVVEIMENCTLQESRLATAKSTYLRLSSDYILGKASKDDVEEIKNSIPTLEKNYQSNLLRFENNKKKLSKIINVDVSNGYTFSKDFSKLTLERKQLTEITDYALKNDYKVYQAELTRKTLDTEVTTLRNIYNSRWGAKVSEIESEIAKNGPIDFLTFQEKYDAALESIEEPYTGYYSIRILFITINIPKEWFRSEYSGIRYFEDQKYALYVSLMDRAEAVKEEEEARKDLTAQVEDSFNSLLELWSAYEDSLSGIDNAKLRYNQLKELNLTGNASFMDVESAKNDILSFENAMLSSLIAYNKALASFDFTTSGAVTKLLSGVSLAPAGKYDSGLSWLSSDADAEKPMWYMNTLINEYKFVFGISIPEDSEIAATHYELCTEDGSLIGARTAISSVITHLPLVYEGTTKLIVKLYKESTLTYTAEIDAANYTGTLDLKPVSPGTVTASNDLPASGTLMGNWILVKNNDNYTSQLTLDFDKKWNVGFYELTTASGDKIGNARFPAATPVSHLSITFSSMENLTLKLFDTDGNSLGDALILNDMNVQVIKMK
jgi:hypothetical protein